MAKQQSLAAQAGVVDALQLPAVFSAPAERIEGKKWPPYFCFAHPRKTDEWNKLTATFGKVEEGDMFLVDNDQAFALNPTAKLGWLCHKQFWALANGAGEVQKVSFKEMPDPFKERVEAVVLVYLEDRIVVANAQFRTTKCPAAKSLSDALAEAGTEAWAGKSPAHRETLALQQSFARFYGLVSLGPTRTGKSSGMPYRPTQCTIKPTSVPEWRVLDAFSKAKDTSEALQRAAAQFESRVAEMKAKS